VPRRIPSLSLLAVCTLVLAAPFAAADDPPTVRVYKSPTCGCCTKWIRHLERSGFEVEATDVRDVRPIKRSNGLPRGLDSCHTAFVGPYLIEGHVPAADIERLLEEAPEVAGLAVPEMPIGSPGMEGPNPVAYEVLAFDGDGETYVFSRQTP